MIRVALALACLTGVAVAQPTEAERYYAEGQKAYEDRRYDDAIAAWQKSYDLSHLPGLVFNLAQAYRLHGDCSRAVASYRKFVQLDPASGQRDAAEGFVKELEPCHDKPAPAKDTTEPKQVAVSPPPPPRPHVDTLVVDDGGGKRLVGVVATIAGAATIATGVYFGNQARSLGDEVRAACMMGCAYSTVADKDTTGRRDERLQWILYGAGGAALVTGGVLYWLGARDHHVVVLPDRTGGSVAWSTTW
jgi:tetratricopeptide (TPR) repeat protein